MALVSHVIIVYMKIALEIEWLRRLKAEMSKVSSVLHEPL